MNLPQKDIIMLWQVGKPKTATDALRSIQQGVEHFRKKHGSPAHTVIVREEQAVAWGLDGSIGGCLVERLKKGITPGCVEIKGAIAKKEDNDGASTGN